jgi:sugar lactone lactonase YvrE
VALVIPDGSARQVADGLAFPNGMAVTPDNATLIVAESDGICLDADGAVWYGEVGNRRCVRVREGGEVLRVIDLDGGCFACVLGGQDRRTLFMAVNQWSGAEDAGGERRSGLGHHHLARYCPRHHGPPASDRSAA